MSPDSIVNAGGRRGSIVPELIDASVDSRMCVVGSVIFLLGVGSESHAPRRERSGRVHDEASRTTCSPITLWLARSLLERPCRAGAAHCLRQQALLPPLPTCHSNDGSSTLTDHE